MSAITRHAGLAKPAAIRAWLGMFTVLLLVLQISFVHVHLLTEHHHLDGIHIGAAAGSAHDNDHHHEHDPERDTHQPHSASDHLLQIAAKHRTSFLAVVALPAESAVVLIRPDADFVCINFTGGIAPSESPPDPLQPRAPPLA